MSKFIIDINAFCEKAKKNPETVMRQVSLKLFSAIIKASPVDTGRFRGNWNVSGPTPDLRVSEETDRTGTKAVSSVVDFTLNYPRWTDVTLSNNLPYAIDLEYGSSKQAPEGVVRTNALRFQRLINEEAAKVR